MTRKIAINGFGRIGRLCLRNLLQDDRCEVVAINDLTDIKTLAHLFKFDSSQGSFDGTVSNDGKNLIVNGNIIFATSEKDPEKLPWKELNVDVVLECTGIFRTRDGAGKHLKAGAKKVIMSAPAKSNDVQTIVLGVNDEKIDPSETIYSNASCTTNCLAPVVKIVNDTWGLVQGTMSTVHAYTADQRLQDAPHSDLRRARAAAVNIVPTSTGAAAAVAIVIPAIAGKINAMAIRVPVISGSLIELNCIIDKETTVEEINAKFKEEAENGMAGILQYSEDELVSSDILRNKHSCIFDSKLTMVMGKMIKIVSWYDNEAGYSARLSDLALKV